GPGVQPLRAGQLDRGRRAPAVQVDRVVRVGKLEVSHAAIVASSPAHTGSGNGVPAPKVAAAALSLMASLASERVVALAAVSVRNLDERVKERLRGRAARHGRSVEAGVRAVLAGPLAGPGR